MTHTRLGIALGLLLLWIGGWTLIGCGAGGGSAATQINGGTRGSVSGLTLRVKDVLNNQALSSIAIHVQSAGGLVDVQAPTTASVTPGQSVTVQIPVQVDVPLRLLVVGLNASTECIESGVSDSFSVAPGTIQTVSVTLATSVASSLEFQSQPVGTTVSTVLNPITVAVLDQNGVLLNSLNGQPITMALGNNPGGATLSGTLTQTTTQGLATFNDLSLDQVAVGDTLIASSSGVATITSAAFNIAAQAGAATHLLFVQQPTQTAAASTISPPITVAVEDAGGTLVTSPSVNVTMSIANNAGAGTLSGTLTVPSNNGIATFNNLSINEPGAGYTLRAASNPLTSATSNAFTITAVGGIANALFVLNPTAKTIDGFTLPSLGSISGFTSISLPATPTVLTVLESGGNTTLLVGLNAASNNLQPIRVDANGVATFLPPLTLANPPAAILGTGVVAYVVTSATTNNLFAIAVNADGSLGSLLSTSTVGGVGNTVVPGSHSFISLTQNTLDVITNGTTANVSRFSEIPPTFSLSAAPTSTITVGGAGNVPVACTIRNNNVQFEVFATSGQTANVTAVDLNLNNPTIQTVGGAGNTPIDISNGGGSNFTYVLTNGTTANVTAIPSSGTFGAPLAPITLGAAGNLPTTATAQDGFNGQLNDLMGTMSGAANNVYIMSANDSNGSLGSPSFASASAANPTSPAAP